MSIGSRNRNQERIIAKIKALCAKTPDRGATIWEACAAWRKAVELAKRHKLNLQELGLDQEPDWLGTAPDPPTAGPETENSSGESGQQKPDEGSPSGFDYSALPPEIAGKLKEIALKVRNRSVQNAIEIGQELLAVKSVLKHGRFLKYFRGFLKAELGMSLHSAQNHMGLAQLLSDPKNAKFENIPVTGLYILASRSTPESARQMVRDLLGTGRTLMVAEVAKIVSEEKDKGSASSSADTGGEPSQKDGQPNAENISIEAALAGISGLIKRFVPEPKWSLIQIYLAAIADHPINLLLDHVRQEFDSAQRKKAA
jgi:Protein of unknown function (DUF3102)